MTKDNPATSKTFSEEDIHHLIFQQLEDPPDLIELQKSIIQWAVDLLDASAGEIFLWDPDRQALVLTLPTGFTQRYSDKYQGVALKPGEGLAGRAFQSMQPMIIKDYYGWEGRSHVFTTTDGYDLQSVLAVPMIWQGTPIGVLTINARMDEKIFDEADVRLASLFSNIAAVSILNARMYGLLQVQTRNIQNALQQEVINRTEELQRHNTQLNLSAQVSREITSIFDLDRLLNQVVNRISSAFGYYCVLVFLTEPSQRWLVLKAASGEVGNVVLQQGLKVAIEPSSLNGRAAESRELIIENDISKALTYQKDEHLPRTLSELVIPLQVGEQLLGTLDVQSAERNTFSEQEVLILRSLADQVSIALQNSYFYEQSKEIAVLEERNRLARELHDSVTQSLFSLDLHARAIATYMEKDLEKAREQIQALRQTTHDTLQEMRSLIYDLRPVSLKEMGLQQALLQEVDRVKESSLDIRMVWDCDRRFPEAVETGLFRIAQEGLRNAIKHAAANQILVSVKCAGEKLQLCIEDNGRGFDPESITANRQSFGILGMKERAELLHAGLSIESEPGNGTRIRLDLTL